MVVLLILNEFAKFWTACVNKPVSHIVHRMNASDDEYPYVLRLETEKSCTRDYYLYGMCTGFLITSQWVLVADLCVMSSRIKVVKYGDWTLLQNETTTLSRILKKILHPAFFIVELGDSKLVYNDIGVFLVEKISLKAYVRLSTTGKYNFIRKLLTT